MENTLGRPMHLNKILGPTRCIHLIKEWQRLSEVARAMILTRAGSAMRTFIKDKRNHSRVHTHKLVLYIELAGRL